MNAASAVDSQAQWFRNVTREAEVTAGGQAAAAVVKVPSDPSRCPFAGYTFPLPPYSDTLRVALATSPGNSSGWLSMELYGPDDSTHVPSETQRAGPFIVHGQLTETTVIDVVPPVAGSWTVGLKPQGAFRGAFQLSVLASGHGPTPDGDTTIEDLC